MEKFQVSLQLVSFRDFIQHVYCFRYNTCGTESGSHAGTGFGAGTRTTLHLINHSTTITSDGTTYEKICTKIFILVCLSISIPYFAVEWIFCCKPSSICITYGTSIPHTPPPPVLLMVRLYLTLLLPGVTYDMSTVQVTHTPENKVCSWNGGIF